MTAMGSSLARLVLAAGVAVALSSAASAQGPAEDPAAVVEALNATLLGTMREAGTLGYQGRTQRLAPVLMESFHFTFMARVSAGRHWRSLSDRDKRRYVETFERMSIATYAARFDGYSGEDFEVGEAIDHPRGAVLVRNRLLRPEDEAVAIDYLLRGFEGRWRIVDVFLGGGISEIATKRAEYGSVLGREGIEGLLARLDEKIVDLAEEGSGEEKE